MTAQDDEEEGFSAGNMAKKDTGMSLVYMYVRARGCACCFYACACVCVYVCMRVWI